MIQVSANLGNIPLENAAKVCKDIIKQIKFPQDYYADIGGDYEQMVDANKSFWQALILTVVLIYMVMACLFESIIQPFIIMMTVALSIIGAVAALVFSGSTVTLGVSIGLLMLGGIVVNNGIMLVARINTLKERYGKGVQDVSMPTIIIWAASHRIRPIFMTTTTTVLGLLPMALDRSEASILWSPLAITVIGGLISSTIFTLFVVPCFYATIEGIKERLQNYFIR
jgi:HAE1 family hydrophobic/amphiphilic exporter-1